MRQETRAVHAGRRVDPATGAVTAPIHLSTTFERAADGGYPMGFSYSRESNPNRRMLEECMAELEGAAAALAFSSGMAAATAVIESLPPDRPRRLLLPKDVYYGLRPLLTKTDLADRFEVTHIDMTDLDAVRDACTEAAPGMVWLETPSNPLLRVTDIAAAADFAHAAGAVVVVDNTWATPLLQQPLALGADLALNALTKYIGGHSDIMVGAVASRRDDEHLARMRSAQVNKGAVPSPFECWLALRGVQSLSARMERHCRNAAAIADFLVSRPEVSAVHYPGLASHPQHDVAMRQMGGVGGGMLSFELAGGRAAAMAVAASLELITRATSLGGPHSLIEHRASIEGPGTATPDGLLRLSIGLEHEDDLMEDLAQALARWTA